MECHPYFPQKKLLHFCLERGIALAAFCPLGRQILLDDSTLKAIGERHGKTVAQVAFRWQVREEKKSLNNV